MSAWLIIAALVAGAPKGNSCDDRCVQSVKPCAQQCEKNFPKAQWDGCKQACSGAVPGCKEQCKTEGQEK